MPEANSQKGVLYFAHAIQKRYSLKTSQIFHVVCEFASAWKSILHCKWFEVLWNQSVFCLRIKPAEMPLLADLQTIFVCHKICHKQLSEGFHLNAFTRDYCARFPRAVIYVNYGNTLLNNK